MCAAARAHVYVVFEPASAYLHSEKQFTGGSSASTCQTHKRGTWLAMCVATNWVATKQPAGKHNQERKQ